MLLNGKSFGGLGVSVINKLFIVNDLTLNQILKYSNRISLAADQHKAEKSVLTKYIRFT